MIKKIIFVIKRIIISILFIYAYNVIIFPIGITIPINVFNLIIVSLFGLPAIVALCLFSIFVV